jgi:hypothetical protein
VLAHEIPGEGVRDDGLESGADLDPEAMGRGVIDEQEPPPVGLPADPQRACRAHAEILQALSPHPRNEHEPDVGTRFVLDLLEKDLEVTLVPGRQDAGLVPYPVLEQRCKCIAQLCRSPLPRRP